MIVIAILLNVYKNLEIDFMKKIIIALALTLTSFSSFAVEAQSVNLHCSSENADGSWARMTLEFSQNQNIALLGQHQTFNSAFSGGTPVSLKQTHEIQFLNNFYTDFISNKDSNGSLLLFRVAPIMTNGGYNSSIRVWKSYRTQGEPLELAQDDRAIAFDCVVAQ
jgi:hypothetical protein